MLNKQLQKKVIESLPKIIKAGYDGTKEILNKLGLSDEQAEEALDIINAAVGRSQMYAMGMNPDQFSGDLDEDPIFKAAIKLLV